MWILPNTRPFRSDLPNQTKEGTGRERHGCRLAGTVRDVNAHDGDRVVLMICAKSGQNDQRQKGAVAPHGRRRDEEESDNDSLGEDNESETSTEEQNRTQGGDETNKERHKRKKRPKLSVQKQVKGARTPRRT